VVVLFHVFWQQAFSGDRSIVGKSMSIEGRSFSIIGVLPVGFQGPVKAYEGGYYLPFSALPQIKDWPRLGDASNWWMEVMLRLDKQTSEIQVNALLQASLTRNTETKYLENSSVPLRLGMHDGRTGLRFSSEPLDAPLRPLLGAVGMILLISCTNLAGLMIARGAGRRHQAAIEGALGASRWCLLRRPMIECGLIAIAGALLSLLVAAWGKVAVARWLWPSDIPIDFRYDGRVMLFTFVVALGTVFLFGLLPAWWYSRTDPGTSLRSRSSLGLPRLRWGPALVSIQIALSLVLLVGGGLFAKSLYRLSKVKLGFETESLLSFQLSAAGAGVDGAQRLTFYQGIQDELERLPGVAEVTLASNQLIADSANTTQGVVRNSGQNEGRELDMLFMHIDDSFLKAMRLDLLQGRDFNSSDTKAGENFMIINRQLAATAFPEDNLIGQMLYVDESAFRVVGVCADFKYESLKTTKSISLLPYRQYPDQNERMVFYVRTENPMLEMTGMIQSRLAALNPNLPPPTIKSMDAQIRENIGSDRASAIVSGGLAVLALVLCCIWTLWSHDLQRGSANRRAWATHGPGSNKTWDRVEGFGGSGGPEPHRGCWRVSGFDLGKPAPRRATL
jgi:macrolide transport system ATP-binding/permease protein